ncbi:hypothetical protein ACFCVU_14520 [Peribacillus butanolivorans]|uniref:hypothetical protein n=1 Tax=Peribacillus butanolivorans TaxID=421767 RepID=UPI0035D6BB70
MLIQEKGAFPEEGLSSGFISNRNDEDYDTYDTFNLIGFADPYRVQKFHMD